jgi:hypothetical protein
MPRYRLTSPIVAIDRAGKGMRIRQIACGEILAVPDIDKKSGLTDIVWRGRGVTVFIEDLRKRTERVEITTMASLPWQSDKDATSGQDLSACLTAIGSATQQVEAQCQPTA